MTKTAIVGALAALLAAGAASASDVPLAKSFADPALAWSPCPPIFPAPCELTVLQGDPAKPNADALLRVPAGYVIPAHSHTSAERMILLSGKLTVQYRGNPKVTLSAGDYAYGPAGLPHAATCDSGDPCVLFIAFEQAVDAIPFEGAIGD